MSQEVAQVGSQEQVLKTACQILSCSRVSRGLHPPVRTAVTRGSFCWLIQTHTYSTPVQIHLFGSLEGGPYPPDSQLPPHPNQRSWAPRALAISAAAPTTEVWNSVEREVWQWEVDLRFGTLPGSSCLACWAADDMSPYQQDCGLTPGVERC